MTGTATAERPISDDSLVNAKHSSRGGQRAHRAATRTRGAIGATDQANLAKCLTIQLRLENAVASSERRRRLLRRTSRETTGAGRPCGRPTQPRGRRGRPSLEPEPDGAGHASERLAPTASSSTPARVGTSPARPTTIPAATTSDRPRRTAGSGIAETASRAAATTNASSPALTAQARSGQVAHAESTPAASSRSQSARVRDGEAAPATTATGGTRTSCSAPVVPSQPGPEQRMPGGGTRDQPVPERQATAIADRETRPATTTVDGRTGRRGGPLPRRRRRRPERHRQGKPGRNRLAGLAARVVVRRPGRWCPTRPAARSLPPRAGARSTDPPPRRWPRQRPPARRGPRGTGGSAG
jgi:hypothetical protein